MNTWRKLVDINGNTCFYDKYYFDEYLIQLNDNFWVYVSGELATDLIINDKWFLDSNLGINKHIQDIVLGNHIHLENILVEEFYSKIKKEIQVNKGPKETREFLFWLIGEEYE